MINNRSVLSTSSLLNGPYRARTNQQNLPNNDSITRGADEHNTSSNSNINGMNNQNQGNTEKLNNSERNPGNRANDQWSQAPEKARSSTTATDPRYYQDTPPPEYTDKEGENNTPIVKQAKPVPNSDRTEAMGKLQSKSTENLSGIEVGEGTGDQKSETQQSPKPRNNTIDRADTPPDPQRNSKQPTPRQPQMRTPNMSIPKQVGPPKMRMPQLRIPKMRF